MRETSAINYYYRSNTRLIEKSRTSYGECFGKILCGCASGFAVLILFVLALDASGMTFGRTGQIGDKVSVYFPLLSSQKILLWNTTPETLELTKFIAILTLFVISAFISSVIFLHIKDICNVFLILGLEYIPIPLIGKHLKAQGLSLYFMLFVIGVCLICYSTALRTFLERKRYDYL
jgi:hypothetical protein